MNVVLIYMSIKLNKFNFESRDYQKYSDYLVIWKKKCICFFVGSWYCLGVRNKIEI